MLAWLWTRLSENGPQVSVSGRALRPFPERELERLLRARVLIEQRKADSWSVCAQCDCGLDARPIRSTGDRLRACCPHDAAEDVVLDEDDIRRFSVDPDRLAGAVAASGGLTDGVVRIADGIWLVGAAPTGAGVVLCSDTDMLEAPGTILAIRSAADRGPVIVIASELDAGVALRLREAAIDARELTEVVREDGGRDQFVFDRAPTSAGAIRLVVRRRAQSAVLDGRRLDLPMQMFALFRLLVEQVRERDPVLKKETIETKTGRPANEIVRDLRRSLVGCGLTREVARALVGTVRGYGYRLGLEYSEVAIED